MTRRARRWLAGGAFAAVWVVIALALLSRPGLSTVPLPDPNGYDDLFQAASMVRGEPPAGGTSGDEHWTAFLSTNRPALERWRLGLSRASRVPPLKQADLEAHVKAIGRFKALARLVAMEAESARRSEDWGRLVEISTNGLEFALRVSRGGVLIDDMVAQSIERVVLDPLFAVATNLPAGPAREAARALWAVDGGREGFDQVRLEEERFVKRAGVLDRLAWYFTRKQAQAAMVRTEQKRNAVVAETRRLIVRLAARAYQVEKGAPPERGEQLVPEVLPSLPLDPVTGGVIRVASGR